MKLPNLYVMVLDILARVFERSRIVRRYEIMASHNLASRAQRKCSIVCHDGGFHCPCKIERPFAHYVNLTTVIGTQVAHTMRDSAGREALSAEVVDE